MTFERIASLIPPIDVARPELFAEDRWQEPFRELRAKAAIQYVPESKFGPYWSVTTYKPIVHIEALRLRVNAVAEPERVPASFVHGYRKLMVELSRY